MLKPLDISVIVLTYNEEIHIRRCLENVNQFAGHVYVVDSFSQDKTVDIAHEMGAEVIQHVWENNHSKQFNWALDNLSIQTKWILRLDADEYLLPETIVELRETLSSIPLTVTGIVLKRRHYFLGKWMYHGVYPVKLLRIFRYGSAICEQRLMDEHIQVFQGECMELKHDFVDENLNDLSWWAHKHVNYAIREAVELLNIEYHLIGDSDHKAALNFQASQKRRKKEHYAGLPLFWRSFAYFCYRYFAKGGFLDGKEGFLWHFLQGWWYRTLVDAKVFEIKKKCGEEPEKMIRYISDTYHISLK